LCAPDSFSFESYLAHFLFPGKRMLDWLIDLLILVGLLAIGWTIWATLGITAVVGYVGGLCLSVGLLLIWRRARSK